MRFIVLLIYSTVLFGICKKGIELPLNDFIDNLSPIVEKPWAAASDKQVKSHTCQSKPLSFAQMKNYLEKRSNLSESLDLMINKRAGLSTIEIKTDLKVFGAQDCEDEICKAQKIFGDKEGVELLYMMEQYGLNGSHIVHQDAKPWSSNDLKPYLEGLAAVPKFMLPLNENQQFTKTDASPDDIADASIMFYGGINKFSDTRVTYTTFHEIAHYVSGSLHVEDDEKWMEASGWVDDIQFTSFSQAASVPLDFTIPEPSTTSPLGTFGSTTGNASSSFSFSTSNSDSTSLLGNSFEIGGTDLDDSLDRTKRFLTGMKNNEIETSVSRYAQRNPLEDIAESMTAYRFNPKTLKELSPKRYEYLKNNVFMGVEYLNDDNCTSTDKVRKDFLKLRKDL
jgi:hypothetical protein